jgi:hypothetical protein
MLFFIVGGLQSKFYCILGWRLIMTVMNSYLTLRNVQFCVLMYLCFSGSMGYVPFLMKYLVELKNIFAFLLRYILHLATKSILLYCGIKLYSRRK